MSVLKPEKDLFSRRDAARYLSDSGFPIAFKTLEAMAYGKHSQSGPPFLKFSWNTVRYKKADLDQWAKANTRRVE